MGNRFDHLQEAINRLFEEIGSVIKISSVYETPAMGFDGDPFLNCVVLIESEIEPSELLDNVLQIEKKMGRERGADKRLVSRPIDIDILFVDDKIINTKRLVVPHPEIQNRKFVLQPLSEIASEYNHPVLNAKVSELLETTSDSGEATKQSKWLSNPIRELNLAKHNYLTIEGNLGVGKTSLTTKIARDFNAKLVLERFADNPFLPKFYEDQARYAFPVEMSFLVDRYQQIVEGATQLDMFKEWIVADYEINKSLIFAGITLSEDEFMLYRKLFQVMYKDFPKPDLYVYLRQDAETLMENIKRRGRDFEQNIKLEYLQDVDRKYLEFIKTKPYENIKVIDVSHLDFIRNRADYLQVLREIAG